MMLRETTRPVECLSELAIDEWRAGEVDAETRQRYEAHVTACSRCAALHRDVDANAAEFLERFPVHPGRDVAGPPRRARRRAVVPAVLGVLLAAAAVMLFFRAPPESGVRTKGGAHVGFYVKRGERIYAGFDGERVRPGDQLRFVVSTTRARHLAVLSLDAKDTASIYYPASAETRPVGPGSELPLDSSVSLDATLGTEHLFALFCDEPIAVERERSALARGHTVDDRAGCDVDRFMILKEKAE